MSNVPVPPNDPVPSPNGAGLPDHARRAVRTLLQLIAGGALTALVAAMAGGLAPGTTAVIMGVWTTIVAYAQNALEDNTSFPAILKAPASSGVNPEP